MESDGKSRMESERSATGTRLFSPPIEAALLMIFVCACFSGMSALIRDMSSEISPFEIAFFRNAIGLALLLPVMWRIGFNVPKGPVLKAYGIRALIGICAMWAWYSALSFTPLAEAITLNFTVALWMIPVAILLLGEKVGLRRWAATIVGFCGVLIVMQPGAQTVNLGSLLAIFAALMFAISMALVRILTRTERPIAIVFYMNLIMTPLSLGPAIAYWTMPDLAQWGWLLFIGFLATIAHFGMARALSLVEASSIIPLDFTRLPFAAAIGYFAFGEMPSLWLWPGAALIAASAIYIARREAKLQRAATTPNALPD
jgi:drug/metabolite transporter (DMT)-like permease